MIVIGYSYNLGLMCALAATSRLTRSNSHVKVNGCKYATAKYDTATDALSHKRRVKFAFHF